MKAPSPPTSPWQRLYGAGHRLRESWYRQRAGKLPRPVVSLGNLHWGGTGKTPLVAAVAAHLRDRGLAVCILSRGYASQGEGVRVVSTGDGPLLGPKLAGDEPVLLAGELPGVAVVVGARRFEAGLQALRRLPSPPDLFLLDDAFSHLAVRRDLDLVALPAADPFGGGRLFPSGRLREPLAAMARAQAGLLTGADSVEQAREVGEALRPYGFSGPVFASFTRPDPPRGLGGAVVRQGARVLLVSAIARPERFTDVARELGFEITGELRFPDHHPYPEESLARIAEAFRTSGAETVLTTAKDRVKLLGHLEVPLAELPIHAEPEPAFWAWLDREVDRLLVLVLPPR
jgi:tetraacyldisaccharide 4'-kinase